MPVVYYNDTANRVTNRVTKESTQRSIRNTLKEAMLQDDDRSNCGKFASITFALSSKTTQCWIRRPYISCFIDTATVN